MADGASYTRSQEYLVYLVYNRICFRIDNTPWGGQTRRACNTRQYSCRLEILPKFRQAMRNSAGLVSNMFGILRRILYVSLSYISYDYANIKKKNTKKWYAAFFPRYLFYRWKYIAHLKIFASNFLRNVYTTNLSTERFLCSNSFWNILNNAIHNIIKCNRNGMLFYFFKIYI